MRSTLALFLIVAIHIQSSLSQILAIDFGTQYIKSAFVGQGMGKSFTIVQNPKSERKFLNSIGFFDEQRLYESQSIGKRSKLPTNCFVFTKLLIDSVLNPQMLTTIKKDLFLQYINPQSEDQLMANFILKNFPEGQNELTLVQVVAMILKYSKMNAQKQFKMVIKDAIITIPSFWNLKMRAFIIEAAQVAQLYVLSLISENTGATINYAVGPRQKSMNQTILFYNLGASSLQMTLAEFKPVQDEKSKKPVQSIFILADYGVPYSGGLRFDRVLFQYFKQKFQRKYSRQMTKRAQIKLFEAVSQIKQILSANKQAVLFVQGIMDGIDYSEKITRNQFEQRSQQLFKNVVNPVKRFLFDNNLKPEDLTGVELIGGSIRIPKLQSMLAEVIGNQSKIGTHINGDQSMVLGAAFYGANSSKKFKIKGLNLYDGFNFQIRAILKNLEQGISEEDPQYFSKNVTIFKKKSRFGMTKELNFKCNQNIVAQFYKQDENGLQLIQKVKFPNIQNINQTDFKVSLTLAIDPIHTVIVKKSQIKYKRDEISTYVEKVKKQIPAQNEQEAKVQQEPQQETQKQEEQVEGKTQQQENQEKQDEQSKSQKQQEQLESKEQKEKSKQKKKNKSKKKKPKVQYQTVQRNKTVTKTYEKELKFKTIYSHQIDDHDNTQKSKELLKKYQKTEHDRKLLHQARNKLQSLVYELKDKLDSQNFLEFVQDSEKQKLTNLVNEKSDWQDQNYSDDRKEYQSHFKQLNKPFEKIKKRINQYEGRQKAKKNALKQINKYQGLGKNITEKKSWIEDQVIEQFAQMIQNTKQEIDNMFTKMSETPMNQNSIYLLEDYNKLAEKVKDKYFKIMATPEPKKEKKSKKQQEKQEQDIQSEEL